MHLRIKAPPLAAWTQRSVPGLPCRARFNRSIAETCQLLQRHRVSVTSPVLLLRVAGLKGDTAAATLPLATSLAGVSAQITDSAGVSQPALLYGTFASAGQVNLVLPAGLANGLAGLTLTLPEAATAATVIQIAPAAPGIFTVTANGQGLYAGQVIYAHADGSQTVVNSTAGPIDLSTAKEQVFLVLYGTGIRHAGIVTATANGVPLPVQFFGAQGQYPGLDQINLQVPVELTGAGTVNLVVTAGQPANVVTINIR